MFPDGYDFEKINKMILSHLPSEDSRQVRVIHAMNEAMRCGGKRIRPILMYETYLAFAHDKSYDRYVDEILAYFMTSIEMIHTFSLIHDDLPCMDGDRLRRGHPTTWVTYGEDMATLAGDGLSLYAFEIALDAARRSDHKKRSLKALYVLAFESGINGMLGGQSIDVELTGQSLDADMLDYIDNLKTGALIAASMKIGAILAGARKKDIERLDKVAHKIGRAYQITDDILDIISDESTLGKPIGSDKDNNKTTFVSILGIDGAKKEADKLTKEAISILDDMQYDMSNIIDIITYLTKRDR